MTMSRAALLAAIGVLLRALHYWVANVIPSWNSSGVLDQISLAIVAVADPVIWTYYFAAANRLSMKLAALLGLAEIVFAVYRQWETLSLLSLDTLAFAFGGLVPVLCWTLYLLRGWRTGLWYLLLAALVQVSLLVYQVSGSWPLVQEFWHEEPWQLVVAPALWIFYWVTQALFVRTAQKA